MAAIQREMMAAQEMMAAIQREMMVAQEMMPTMAPSDEDLGVFKRF